jgi:tetratricopeptide (TPR) repeat protein
MALKLTHKLIHKSVKRTVTIFLATAVFLFTTLIQPTLSPLFARAIGCNDNPLNTALSDSGKPTPVRDIIRQADAFVQAGNFAAAANLQKKYKKAFQSGSLTLFRPITDPSALKGGANIFWRDGIDGVQQDLEVKATLALSKLSENYPEFIPGHIKLAEAYVKWGKPEKAIDALERGFGLYPDQDSLVAPLVQLMVNRGMLIEASVTARQFALINPDNPQAGRYNGLADQLYNRFRSELQQQFVVDAALSRLLGGDSSNLINLVIAGENAVGNAYMQQVRQTESLLPADHPLTVYVREVGNKLARLADRNDLQYEFWVSDSDVFNASAYPGGKIIINKGLIADMQSEAELAGIIGHEISHAVLSHGYQKVATQAKLSALNRVPVIGTFLRFSNVILTNSREYERQADILGTRLLVAAGYSADGLHSVMSRLAEREGRRGTGWFDTHPASVDRAAYLEALIQGRNYNRFAFEGAEPIIKVREAICGATPTVAVATPPSRPTNRPSTPARLGEIPLTAALDRSGVTVKLTKAQVERNGSFALTVEISNKSRERFSFIPFYTKVYDASQRVLNSRFDLDGGAQPVLEPGQTITGKLSIFRVRWNDSGKQDMTFELKETSTGARVFRVAF